MTGESWDEEARQQAVMAARARPSGFYWIRRHEADGESGWEVARFVGQPWSIPGHDKPGWYVTGRQDRLYEVAGPFSNFWEIGPRVEKRE